MPDPRLVQQGIDRRARMYDFICDYIAIKGYAPSMREIAKGVGASVTTVREHLLRLSADGLLNVAPSVERGITVVVDNEG